MKGKSKEVIVIILTVFIFVSFMCMYQQSGNQLTKDDLIRFHVVANSNTKEDQQLKLKVRDAVLEEISQELSEKNNINESRQWLINHSEEINDIAKRTIASEGEDYSSDVELGIRWIPEKSYGNITLPAGNYQAFTIKLGEAQGENWWCVMFPPICIIGENSAEYSEDVIEDFQDTKYEEMIELCNGETPYVLKFQSKEIYKKIINFIK